MPPWSTGYATSIYGYTFSNALFTVPWFSEYTKKLTTFQQVRERCRNASVAVLRMRDRLPLHILLLHTQFSRWAHAYRGYASFSDICGAWVGFGSGFGIGFKLLLTRSSPSRHPPFTQYPSPSRSLVRDGQTSPHKPRLVVPHSTCPPLSPSPPAHSFIIGPAVINTHIGSTQPWYEAMALTKGARRVVTSFKLKWKVFSS